MTHSLSENAARVAALSYPEPHPMRKLIVAFLLPKVVSYLRRRYAGRTNRPSA